MQVTVKDSYEEMCSYAAEEIANAINSHKGTRPFVLGLPTGSTPIGVYDALVKMHKEGKLSFKNVVTFNMDEYVGLPENHPESYHSFMKRYLFDHIDIPRENINILDGNAENLKEECRRYEEKIKAAGGVDFFMGGIGVDGHLAFNEPGSSLDSRTREMPLEEDTRKVNSRFFDNDVNQVPKTALTVGIGTVCDARRVMVLASGKNKAHAVYQSVKGPVSTQWTCSALQNHANSMMLCDKEAASEL
ncbi:MAG: glucosamine-6-phosphate deaminase [Sphaerochaetaceae bacterium]|nr:glucosamine-6-phosphate deaminase [Sphaerochaetaceae bacterium]